MRSAGSRSSWPWIAREPLVHFAAIGLVLFAVDGWRHDARSAALPADAAGAPAPSPRAPIAIDSRVRAEIGARAERRLGHAPTADELAAETERWIDEEILYREGLERGLDRFDPTIRARVASRMSFVLEQELIVPEPTELELTAWFEAHRERWSVPEKVDFTHVFVAGDDASARARANDLAAALAAGAPPERLGDRFAGGRHYRGRRLADLAQTFGEPFADGLDRQPPGHWIRRRSRFGEHVVRVDRVEPGRRADFAAARLDVRKAWRDAERDRALRASLARERSGWEIVRP